MVTCPCCFGTWRQEHVVEKLITLWQLESKERGRSWGSRIPFPRRAPVTSLPLSGPCLLKVCYPSTTRRPGPEALTHVLWGTSQIQTLPRRCSQSSCLGTRALLDQSEAHGRLYKKGSTQSVAAGVRQQVSEVLALPSLRGSRGSATASHKEQPAQALPSYIKKIIKMNKIYEENLFSSTVQQYCNLQDCAAQRRKN